MRELSIIVLLVILAICYDKISKLTYSNSILEWKLELATTDSIVDSCFRCGNIQTVYLYKFNEDTIKNQKVRKSKRDSLYSKK